jgi:hydroxypyruvate reductase/glycerate 2-kinase
LKKNYNPKYNKLRKDLLESINAGMKSVDPFICVNNYFSNQQVNSKQKDLDKQNINSKENNLQNNNLQNSNLININFQKTNLQNINSPNYENNLDNIDYSNFKNIFLIAFGKAAIRMSLAIIIRFNISDGIICSNEEISNIEEKFISIFNSYENSYKSKKSHKQNKLNKLNSSNNLNEINDKENDENKKDFLIENFKQIIKTNSRNIKYIKGGHPLPDENSIEAGNEIIKILEKADEEDLVFVLISGGGSALIEKPLTTFETLKSITSDLLKKGADIHELNTIRKHLSAIKGGRLISQTKGKVISLILSDVPGDPLDSIASGPTYHDSTTFEMALSILKKYELTEKYPQIEKIFTDGINGKIPETLKEKEYKELYFKGKIKNFLVGSNHICCKSIINSLIDKNYNVIYLGSLLEGNAEDLAKSFTGFLRSICKNQFGFIFSNNNKIYKIDKTYFSENSFSNLPLAIVWGGETTVIVKGNGKGGRNQHFVLSFLENIIKNINNIDLSNYLFSICSFGTDGVDGSSEAAGAIADNWSLEYIETNNINIYDFIKNSDSFTLFEKLGDAIITGATGTNVTDVGVLIVDKR